MTQKPYTLDFNDLELRVMALALRREIEDADVLLTSKAVNQMPGMTARLLSTKETWCDLLSRLHNLPKQG